MSESKRPNVHLPEFKASTALNLSPPTAHQSAGMEKLGASK